MAKSAFVHARIESGTKRRAEDVLRALGLSPTEAIRLFYHQICLRSGVPFSVQVPNPLTRRTLTKSRAGKEIHAFESLNDLFASWEK